MADVRILNQGQWNECTVRQMTDEERARYGPPTPVPERIRLMRAKAKENPHYSDTIDGYGLEMYDGTECTAPNRTKEATTMNNLGPKVDRVRMFDLCREHGTDNAAVKKIAIELNCSRQTVDAAIRKEKIRERLAAEKEASNAKTETKFNSVTSVEPSIGSEKSITIYGTNADGAPVKETIRVLSDEKQAPPIATGHIDMESNPPRIVLSDVDEMHLYRADEVRARCERKSESSTDESTSDSDCRTFDAAFYAVLDDLAAMYNSKQACRNETTKALAKEGLRGLRELVNSKNTELWESLRSASDASGPEFTRILREIANAAIQGLMFLDSLDEW